MATHKVPQDVETEDKLIGFLSMKQFIFVVVGLGFGYLTFYFATKVHPLASLIWVPFTVVPLVLGLYQRPDQPVEVFLASALRFYLKPRKRKWDQEGFVERVEITAPPKIEHHYTKDFSGEEAVGHLQRLSRVMDSRGWASKLGSDWQNPQLAATATSDSRLQAQAAGSSAYLEAYMQPADVMDEASSFVAQDFQSKIETTDTSARARALKVIEQARTMDTTTDTVPVATTIRQQTADTTPAGTNADTGQVLKDDTGQDMAVSSTPEPEALPKTEPNTTPVTTDDGSVEISLH